MNKIFSIGNVWRDAPTEARVIHDPNLSIREGALAVTRKNRASADRHSDFRAVAPRLGGQHLRTARPGPLRDPAGGTGSPVSVEPRGLEPRTPALQRRCSAS